MATTPIVMGPYTVYHLAIDQAGDTGPTALVAAAEGRRIVVPSLHLQATPAGTFQLFSAAQALTPALPMAATGGFNDRAVAVLPGALLIPVLWTEKGEALNLTTVTAAAKGYLKWFYWSE